MSNDIGRLTAKLLSASVATVLPVSGSSKPADHLLKPDGVIMAESVHSVSLEGATGVTVENAFPGAEDIPEEWTRGMERNFQRMAAKEALNELSSAELAQLEKLATIRRLLHHPRTADEILADLREAAAVDDLTRALDRYVKYHRNAR